MIENYQQNPTTQSPPNKLPNIKTIYQPQQWYTLTICPSDKKQFYNKPNRYQLFHNYIYELMLNQDHHTIIEISEPFGQIQQKSSGPRLHTHGIINFPTRQSLESFLIFTLPSWLKLNRIEIDTLTNPAIWYQYIHKQHILAKTRNMSNHLDPNATIWKPLIQKELQKDDIEDSQTNQFLDP